MILETTSTTHGPQAMHLRHCSEGKRTAPTDQTLRQTLAHNSTLTDKRHMCSTTNHKHLDGAVWDNERRQSTHEGGMAARAKRRQPSLLRIDMILWYCCCKAASCSERNSRRGSDMGTGFCVCIYARLPRTTQVKCAAAKAPPIAGKTKRDRSPTLAGTGLL